jgi:hypothetical protein
MSESRSLEPEKKSEGFRQGAVLTVTMNARGPDDPADPEHAGELSRKLQEWRVEPVIPADFQREVWHRIAARQAEPFWRPLTAWLEGMAARPAAAMAFVLTGVAAGLMVGREKAQVAAVESWRVLEERYAHSVNPASRHVDYVNHLNHSVE